MAKALVAAAVLWPVLLAGGAVARMEQRLPWLATVTYLAGGAVCHQRPERSFHTHAVQWPVCGRCSGLYIAAAIGASAAAALGTRFRRARDLRLLALAAVPTAVTFALEHFGLSPMTSFVRFAAALPLGAAIAWVIVGVAADDRRAIE